MLEHQGFMWHYKADVRGRVQEEFLSPSDALDVLLARAREFVGTHNPEDGMSNHPHESVSGNSHTIWRGTSFGTRMVAVTQLSVQVVK